MPVRNMVRDLLEERGVVVVEAKDGQEAMTAFMKESFDLVITDFLMPRVDGMQLIRNIRMSGDRGRVPVVLMSAISRSQIMSDHPDLGPDYYVNKPVKPKKMSKILDRVLREIERE
jgi:CheY-like chemotaxis protein